MIASTFSTTSGGFLSNVPSIHNFGQFPDFKFLLNITPRINLISSSGVTGINSGDSHYIYYYPAIVTTDFLISADLSDYNRRLETIDFYVRETGKFTNPISGVSYFVTGGATVLTGISNSYLQSGRLSGIQVTGANFIIFQNYLEGSCIKYLRNDIEDRINKVYPYSGLNIYSNLDITNNTYTLNTGHWATGMNLSCVSVWNSTLGNRMAGTLISPKHIIFAAHYPISSGATIKFAGTGNQLISRIVTGVILQNNTSTYYPDYAIGVLDNPIMEISYAKFLPDNYLTKIPSIVSGYTICFNQYKEAYIKGLFLYNSNSGTVNTINFKSLTTGIYSSYYRDTIGGDSGCPALWYITGDIIIHTVFTSGPQGQGSNYALHKSGINNLMSRLDPTYQLTEIDLSSFVSV